MFDRIPVLKGIPISPYPSIGKCFGLYPRGAMIEIVDRYMRVGYDFKVQPADKKCLFNVFEDEATKFERWEEETGEKVPRAPKIRQGIPPQFRKRKADQKK